MPNTEFNETRIAIELTQIGGQLRAIEDRLNRLEEQNSKLVGEIDKINEAAARWKGGFIVVVAIGGIIGWLGTLGGNVAKIWGH